MLVVKKEFLENEPIRGTPSSMNWKKVNSTKEKIFNTPDVASVYMLDL